MGRVDGVLSVCVQVGVYGRGDATCVDIFVYLDAW